jgi:hypothetical protein
VSTQALEATGAASFTLATTSVTKMKANMEEVRGGGRAYAA